MGAYYCAIEKRCFVAMRWSGKEKKQFISIATTAPNVRLGRNSGIGTWGPTVLLPEDEALMMAENIIKMINEKREATQ